MHKPASKLICLQFNHRKFPYTLLPDITNIYITRIQSGKHRSVSETGVLARGLSFADHFMIFHDSKSTRKMSFFHSFLRGTFCFVALPAIGIGLTALQFGKAEEIKNKAERTPRIAIIGSGIGGSATAHFVREIFGENAQISVFEKADRMGGRLATVDFVGETFESGGSIIHPKNLYMKKFVKLLGISTYAPFSA